MTHSFKLPAVGLRQTIFDGTPSPVPEARPPWISEAVHVQGTTRVWLSVA